MEPAFKVNTDKNGITRVIFDTPGEKVNKFNKATLTELMSIVEKLASNTPTKLLVFESAKPDIFVAGADIEVLASMEDEEDAKAKAEYGHRLFYQISQLPYPTVALIDGACLGGGCEFALACDFRVATDNPKTQIGLPEVNLGIIPGWGGSQRLPRLIGLTAAMPIVLGGKPLTGFKAWKAKLVDELIPKEFLVERFEKFLEEIEDPKKRQARIKKRKSRTFFEKLMEGNPLGRALVYWQTKKGILKKTKGVYPAPLEALRVVSETFGKNFEKGCEKEIQAFSRLAPTPTCKNLIQLFFNSEALKKETGVEKPLDEKELPKIKSAGVLGGGIMGGGIGWLFSYRNIPARIKDIDWGGVAKGYAQASKIYNQLKKIRKLKPFEIRNKMQMMTGTLDYSGFKQLDLIVEAIVENIDVKKKVFQELEKNIRDDAIVCTNTSSLSVNEMAKAFEKPERFAGLHFFNPVNRMPLVEIISGDHTSPKTIQTLVALVKKLGKTPVVVKDCAGFLVNRILVPYMNEALWLAEEGISIEKIDQAILKFGMPMGPFELADEVGIDVLYHAGGSLQKAYGSRMQMAPALEKMFQNEIFGKKSGAGFYFHNDKKKGKNPKIDAILPINESLSSSITSSDIIERTIYSMINEACKCLEEKVVKNAPYLDMAMIMGTGFPPYRGGVLRYADSVGILTVLEKLKKLEGKYGERYSPSKLLAKMAEDKTTFYPGKKSGASGKRQENQTEETLISN